MPPLSVPRELALIWYAYLVGSCGGTSFDGGGEGEGGSGTGGDSLEEEDRGSSLVRNELDAGIHMNTDGQVTSTRAVQSREGLGLGAWLRRPRSRVSLGTKAGPSGGPAPSPRDVISGQENKRAVIPHSPLSSACNGYAQWQEEEFVART